MLEKIKMFKVIAIWDKDAEMWSVDESDIPGLATCAPTVEQFEKNCLELIPELLELNSHLLREDIADHVLFDIFTRRQHEVARCA